MPDTPAITGIDIPPSHEHAPLLGDGRYQHDAGGVFRELYQTHGPVAPVLLPGGVPAWLTLDHQTLRRVTEDTATFARSSKRWRLGPLLPPDWPLWPLLGGGQAQDSLLYAEGEMHRQRAGALSSALEAVDRNEFAARCQQISEQLLARFAPAGAAELMADYALQLPVLAMSWALGAPEEDSRNLPADFAAMLSGGPDTIAGWHRARAVVARLVAQARRRPGANVASRLAAHPIALSDEQLVEDLLVTYIAGHIPTAYLIGTTLRLMLTGDRFTDTLRRGRLSVSDALHEILWHDTPTQVFAGRFTSRVTELGRYRIPARDLVLLGLAAANTDPALRPDPAAGVRDNRAYLSYSHGPHSCPMPARDLSEVMASTAIEALLDALPGLSLACHPNQLRWVSTIWMRGLESLPVRFDPAALSLGTPRGLPWM
ncbi:cytochrome [Streptomyces sp. WAC 06783]|uniref:cytochrome P450 n=1 Tax=Streptomyces sp. WAC 06783 TaxID=2203211 RepID=UPI000F74537A|nr:cytochrome P450 [Streptomyces sp. WAC 06783]RSO07031.1 cytochrome [Streptomyces sp. WAC 06783]